MTFDDIYKLCTATCNDTESNAYQARENARRLASIIVAIGPVAQAAEKLADINAATEMSAMANAYRVIEHGRCEATVIKAVEAMRERLAKP
jgi:hypothetical protein